MNRLNIQRIAFLLLFIIVGSLIYSNTLEVPFVFDDLPNIQDNPHIRLTKLTLDGIASAGFESLCSNRPVANISFALNYYFNRYNVAGYHFVNILMHIITGIILFYFIRVTLLLSNFQDKKIDHGKNSPPNKRNCSIHNSINSNIITTQRSLGPASSELTFIAFFTTLIWLVHPLQTQTVTYIVQRMSGMTAMFYVLSLILYVKARLANTKRKKKGLFFGFILSGILSLGSKEIAATLPFFILLYEWFFFQQVSLKWLKRNSIYFLCILLLIILLTFFFVGSHPIKTILSGYNTRDFTLWQRVLTEFRVVIYYISLIIFPHPMRLNLIHDITISRSFIDPTTTLISFIAILGLIVMAIWLAKRERLLSFCVLWFLGNLVIESSVVSLEIIFEHRTYLPSMLVCLLFVTLGYRLIKFKWFGVALILVVVAVFSFWTYQRNEVWRDGLTLWQDVVNKAPKRARSQYNLGIELYARGRTEEAVEHLMQALRIKPDHVGAHNNLANILDNQGRIEEAIEHYLQVLRIEPDNEISHNNLGNALDKLGHTEEAIEHYLQALKIWPDYASAHNNLAIALLRKGDIEGAIAHFRKALKINPNYSLARENLQGVLRMQKRKQ